MKIKDINDSAVMIVSLVLAIVLLLTGCGADTVNDNVENKDNYMQEYHSFNFYVDAETCVEYIVFHDTYKGGLTPRLNDDSTLKLNENCLNEGSK